MAFSPTGPTYLAAFPVAYATVWLGLLNPPKAPFEDLSYGVFLFHFPLLMAIHQTAGDQTAYLQYVGIVLALSVACTGLSWTWIEKPILDRKRWIITRLETIASGLARSDLKAGRTLGSRL